MTLSLSCKTEPVVIDFTNQIRFFYGKISAGKTLIVKLIDFCFGGDLVKPRVIQDELMRLIRDFDKRRKCSKLMLENNLRSGINNVISLIFSQYENFESELNKW